MQFCCPPGSWPALSEGEYTGKFIALPSKTNPATTIQCYLAGEEYLGKSARAVIACPDIFGMESGRVKLVCDTFASELKCPVLMPDFVGVPFVGGPMDSAWSFMKFVWWCLVRNTSYVVDRHATFVADFLEANKLTSVATVSFCFGTFHAVSLSQAFPKVFTWGLVAFHPSLQVTQFANPLGPHNQKLLSNLRCPVYIAATIEEPLNVKPNGDAEKWIRENAKQEVAITVFDTMHHGFVNRGDVKDEAVRLGVEKALTESISFLGTRRG